MTTRKITVACALASLGVVLGVGALVFFSVYQAPSKGSTPAKEPDNFPFHGKVVDSAGAPLAGAKLLLLGAGDKPVTLGTSAADGTFTVSIPKDSKSQNYFLAAQVDGAGIDFLRLPKANVSLSVQMRVVEDQLIRGRITNTEGKALGGVKVSVTDVVAYGKNSLDLFLTQWKLSPDKLPNPRAHLVLPSDSFLSTTTDADGRFTIAGTGTERIVELWLHGGGIAESRLWVANRAGFDAKPYNQAAAEMRAAMPFGYGRKWLLYGPDLEIVAEPERWIRGVVKDVDTGKPRPGVQVKLGRDGDELLPLPMIATTDAEGRYEIRGARKGTDCIVEVPSDPAQGFMAAQVHVPDSPGYEPVNADIAVKKGVIVTGRVIDGRTKKPLPGTVMIEVLAVNTFAKTYPVFSSSTWSSLVPTDADGMFRVVTIPGPVLLMGGADWSRLPDGPAGRFRYKPVVPDPKYPDYFTFLHDVYGHFPFRGGFSALHGNYCKVLQIEPGAAVVTQDIVVEPATALPMKIEDPGGKAIGGALVTGMSPQDYHPPVQLRAFYCSAYDLEPGKPRLMVFYSLKRKLAATLALKGDEKEPLIVKLAPAEVVEGRLVGEDGKPLAGIVVTLAYSERTAAKMHDVIYRGKPVATDADGRFKFEEVIPGPRFSLAFRQGNRIYEPLTTIGARSVQVGNPPLDLGEVKLKPKPES